MGLIYIAVETDDMVEGVFYAVRTNKDGATLLVRADMRKIEVDFKTNKLVEIPDVYGRITVWRWLNKEQNYKVNVTHGVSILMKGTTAIIQASYDFEGQIDIF